MVVKKIFDGVFDDEVHADFLKFGKGKYENKYLIEGKRQANKWAIKAGAEYANFLVRKCLGMVNSPIAIKGVIVSTLDLKDEIKFDIVKVKNFQGIRKNVVDTEVEPVEILNLMDKYPKVFFALSFKGSAFVLKIKAKAPKNEKAGKDGSLPVADFCSLKVSDKNIVDELFFGVGEFKSVSVRHTINVTGIVYPGNVEELKPNEIRELSKRKGVICRKVVVDDKEEKISEAEFVA